MWLWVFWYNNKYYRINNLIVLDFAGEQLAARYGLFLMFQFAAAGFALCQLQMTVNVANYIN